MRSIDVNELLDRFSMDDRDQVHVMQIGDVIDAIEGTPTVDPVKHGHWIDVDPYGDDGLVFRCSRCNGLTDRETPYCPYCGARLIEKNEVVK